MHRALTRLAPPTADAPPEAWQTFAHQLQTITITHRNTGHDWHFTPAQAIRLIAYFRAN